MDERDIALSGSCDGFQIFKQKTNDCWVILFINNNRTLSYIYIGQVKLKIFYISSTHRFLLMSIRVLRT